MNLQNRRVVLGVSGGIAAYKAVEVCRRLIDAGAHVSPILTAAATKMVGPATFSALASEPTKTDFWNDRDPIPHTTLGQKADVVLVCPATARCIADLRMGRSGDLLTATLIATEAPIIVCPAMHTEMWNNPAVQENIAVLRSRGVIVVGPDEGLLAGGDKGAGRLADLEAIMTAVNEAIGAASSDAEPDPSAGMVPESATDFAGVTILVTAGGTREPLDPVRFLSNRSSGRQGHALAEQASARGANVILVTASSLPASGVAQRIEVATAVEMAAAVASHSAETDLFIMAAAVSDFRPESVSPEKLKKADGPPEIVLVPNEDILLAVGSQKRPDQLVVGFAAETEDVELNATAKLKAKNADLIIANDVSSEGAGFDHETNAVTIIETDGTRHRVGLTSKHEVASAVLDVVRAIRESR